MELDTAAAVIGLCIGLVSGLTLGFVIALILTDRIEP